MAPPPRSLPSGFLGGGPLEVPDLFDQVSLFIVELFVLRPVVLELAEKLDELGLVLQEDVQDGLRLVGVGHKHLMEEQTSALKLAPTSLCLAPTTFDICTLKTWNASNWMLRLLSRSRFIINLRFSGLLMYFVMMVKLCRSSSSSPSNWVWRI